MVFWFHKGYVVWSIMYELSLNFPKGNFSFDQDPNVINTFPTKLIRRFKKIQCVIWILEALSLGQECMTKLIKERLFCLFWKVVPSTLSIFIRVLKTWVTCMKSTACNTRKQRYHFSRSLELHRKFMAWTTFNRA